MAKKNYKTRYEQLNTDVQSALKKAIEKSKIESKHIEGKCIRVNVFDYTELVIVNDNLTFLDSNGLHYSVYADCTLDDLIDILNQL